MLGGGWEQQSLVEDALGDGRDYEGGWGWFFLKVITYRYL
jgi:hypothetical protein